MKCRDLIIMDVMVKSINRTANKIIFTQLSPNARVYGHDNMRSRLLCNVNTQIRDK